MKCERCTARALMGGGSSEVLLAGMSAVGCTRRDPMQAAIAVIEISAQVIPAEIPWALADLIQTLHRPSRPESLPAAAARHDRGAASLLSVVGRTQP